jgi:hypothetical protein
MNTPKTKLTLRLWKPAWVELNARAEACCLRRDMWLSAVLETELPRIAEELLFPNSDKARLHIEHHYRMLLSDDQAQQVNIAVSGDAQAKLDELCRTRNIPRDVFVSRLVWLLGTTVSDINAALLLFGIEPPTAKDIEELKARVEAVRQARFGALDSVAPLGAIQALVRDPLGLYRAALDDVYESASSFLEPEDRREFWTPFGAVLRSQRLQGLNCLLADEEVPGTEAYAQGHDVAPIPTRLAGRRNASTRVARPDSRPIRQPKKGAAR